MSDYNEDFNLDDQGILREKHTTLEDQGIILDDDGILRDDDRYSPFTYYTDSGFGTVDRKSSSSTLNKLPGSFSNLRDEHLPQDGPGNGSDEILLDGKPVHISDFEVSESAPGDVPGDRASLASVEDLDNYLNLPDDSFVTTDNSHLGYEYSSSQSHQGDVYDRNGQLVWEEHQSDRTGDIENSSISFLNSGEFEPQDGRSHKQHRPSLESPGFEENRLHAGYSPVHTGHSYDSSMRNLIGSYKDVPEGGFYDQHTDNHRAQDDLDIEAEYAANQVFDDRPGLHGQHSLIEFEVLEAQVQAADALGDDLIGAYLSGLEQQEEEEERSLSNQRDPTGGTDEDVVSVSQQFQQNDLRGQHDWIEGVSDSQSSPDHFSRGGAEYNVPPLQLHGLTDTGDSEGLDDSRASRPTKIPMLRERSPSMSRPGSVSPSRHMFRDRSPSPKRPGSVSPTRLLQRGKSPSFSQSPAFARPSSFSPTRHGAFSPSHNVFETKERYQVSDSRSLPRTRQEIADVTAGRSPSPSQFRAFGRDKSGATDEELDQAAALLVSDSEQSRADPQEVPQGPSPEPVPEPVPKEESPKKFKVRRPPPSSKKTMPIRAFHEPSVSAESGEELSTRSEKSKHDLKQKLEKETIKRKKEEDFNRTLMEDHIELQKKLAEAENVIDAFRTGAKVNLYADSPTPQKAQLLTMSTAQQPQVISMAKQGTSTLSVPTPAQQGVMSPAPSQPEGVASSTSQVGASRSTSRASQPYERPPSTTSGIAETHSTTGTGDYVDGSLPDDLNEEDLTETLRGESIKVALRLQLQDLAERLDAFQTLLQIDQLSPEEQQEALTKIKAAYDKVQTEYQQGRDEHNRNTRQSGNGVQFDADNELSGDLFKLGRKLDDLEHHVEGSMQKKSNQRTPFRTTPLKANHDINVDVQQSAGRVGSPGPSTARSRRRPSSGSLAGGPSDIDEQLRTLHKDYDDLMNHYRRLKQLPQSPRRDKDVGALLDQLKNVFENTPEHRRPALPPELESQYNPKKGSFVPPEQLQDVMETSSPRQGMGSVSARDKPHSMSRQPRKVRVSESSRYTESDISSTSKDSVVHRPRRSESKSSVYQSSTSAPSSASHRKKRLPTKPGPHDTSISSTAPESGVSTVSQRAPPSSSRNQRSSRRAHHYPSRNGGVPVTETDRRQAPRSPVKERQLNNRRVDFIPPNDILPQRNLAPYKRSHGRRLPHTGAGPSPRRLPLKTSALGEDIPDSDEDSTESDASTVEYRTPRRQITPRKAGRGRGEDTGRVVLSGSGVRSSTVNKSGGAQGSRGVSQGHRGPVSSSRPAHPAVHHSQSESEDSEVIGTAGGVGVHSARMSQPVDPARQQGYINTSHGAVYIQPVAAPGDVGTQPYQQSGGMIANQYVPQGTTYGPYGEQLYNNDDRLNDHISSRGQSHYRQSSPYQDKYYDEPGTYRDEWGQEGHYELDSHRDDYYRDRYYSEDDMIDGGGYSNRRRSTSPYSKSSRYRSKRDYYIPRKRSQSPYEQSHYRSRDEQPHDAYVDYNHSANMNYDQTYPKTSHRSRRRSRSQGRSPVTAAAYTSGGNHGYQTHSGYTHGQQPTNYVPNQQVFAAYPVNPSYSAPATGGAAIAQSRAVPVQVIPAAAMQPQNTGGQVYVPVQVVPSGGTQQPLGQVTQAANKIRYYVREYGGESDTSHRKRSHRSKKYTVHEAAYSEGENDVEDLDDSLRQAARTAKELKKMSRHMKATLIQDLNISYHNSSLLSALI